MGKTIPENSLKLRTEVILLKYAIKLTNWHFLHIVHNVNFWLLKIARLIVVGTKICSQCYIVCYPWFQRCLVMFASSDLCKIKLKELIWGWYLSPMVLLVYMEGTYIWYNSYIVFLVVLLQVSHVSHCFPYFIYLRERILSAYLFGAITYSFTETCF